MNAGVQLCRTNYKIRLHLPVMAILFLWGQEKDKAKSLYWSVLEVIGCWFFLNTWARIPAKLFFYWDKSPQSVANILLWAQEMRTDLLNMQY